jgi:hypothetical protein
MEKYIREKNMKRDAMKSSKDSLRQLWKSRSDGRVKDSKSLK